MARIGISSDEAFRRLFAEARATIHDWYHLNVVNKLKEPVPHSANHFSRHFCTRILIYARVTLLLLIIGSVDIDNEMQFTLMVINITLFAFSILVQFWQRKCREAQLDYRFRKALKLLDSLEKNFPSIYTYQSTVEPATEETITCQTTFRDGRVVEVPRVLLAQGDIILLRPGQVAPCDCETFEGVALSAGEKLNQKRMLEERPVGAVIPLESVQARVTTFPVKQLLDTVLTMDDKPLQFDYQLHHVVHHVFERILVPFVGFLAIFGSVLRFLYSDDESYFGTRFIFAVPGLAVLPLLVLPLPVILHIVKRANNKKILKEMRLEDREISQKDLASILAAVTGTCITDKKGVLSTIHPLIEKVIFVAKPEESPENVQETGNEDLHIEVLNMSAEQREDVFSGWSLGFEDQHWLRYLPNLMPLAHNILLNSCSQTENFTKFLDHLTVVAQSVPRTIATANRRCMCQFPRIVGFSENCLDQFASPPTAVVGLYKRKPGEAPLPGLTKHRTPIEMAFCTVHSDVRSLHSHLSCHGTANLVLDACTHAWDGKTVVPLNKRLVASIRDYYQRHSMTGHCLAVSYRPVFSSLDESLQGKYLEVPLNREEARTSSAIPRSQSFDTLRREGIVENELLKTSDQVIDHYFTGHIFCGLIVLQYEALPLSVQLIEKLDAICVRPVYFSKENELRSRVFAEKLGIEAGWNCHISLADEEAPTKREEIATEQFIDQRPQRTKFWKRLAMSDAQIHLIECESVSRELPAGQKISMCSNKVGPIPNKARLPTGVSNIRPHLEEVDNVPLLVGLFTDSATLAMEEMVDIMQENGEVVMIIGSSRNSNNSKLFVKSNVSVCVDPVEEPSCKMATYMESSDVNEMAGKLLGLAADFQIRHSGLLQLSSLIVACRHRMASLRASLFFLLHASCLLSLILLFSIFLFLPIIFTHGQILMTSMLHLPVLFFGTLFTPFHPKNTVIRIAMKNTNMIAKQENVKIVTTFFIQFLPTAVYITALYFLLLVRNANMMCSFADVVCNFNTEARSFNSTMDYLTLSTDSVRHIIGFQFTTCLCVLSSAFLYSLSSIWTDVPFLSPIWLISVFFCIFTQVAYSYLSGVNLHEVVQLLPIMTLVVWIMVILLVNELFKIRRIRQFAREQRRTKFDFDTKLGMNSPY